MAKIKSRYVCYNCGRVFTTPKIIEEYVGEYWGRPITEQHEVSPCCEDAFYEQNEQEAGK